MGHNLLYLLISFMGIPVTFVCALDCVVNRKNLAGAIGWSLVSGILLMMAILPLT